jgi:hypothetical protein
LRAIYLATRSGSYGFDAQSGEFGNQVNKGTVRIALQDGASIAGLF